ncbi:hypothetical protein P0Y67_14250 [Photobacterium sp. SP02]|uniref:glycoside hydrolase family 19 protein n=1 Tax=Photobacterium sp. SP02 TaxID=3032280 RepID=UPI0031452254
MKTAFPICQVDGSQFNDVSALKVLLNGQTSGRYIISKGRGWHGGIHFNNRIAFWAQHFQPVQAMADGELVAYRMAEEYPTTQYLETTSSYSNNFCLLRHTFQNPDQEDESYTFYSLYMHLQSQKEIQDSITAAESASQISYIRLKKNWNSRSEPGSADFDKKVLLPKDSILKLIDPSRATVTKDKIRNTEYDFLKVKVVCVGQYVGNKDKVKIQNEADQKLNQEVWLAIKQYGEGTNPEEFWNNLAEPLTKKMPPWHTKNGPENNLPIVADGTVQVPELPINIKAGEHLGYLGKYEYLKNAQGNIDQEYRVHLEVFSNDRPPEYFLNALAGGQEEHGFQVIDGSSSTGVMEPANTFFNDIRRAIDTDNDGQISENELVAFYQAATNRLEKVIAKHPSEWYSKAEEHWFNQVLAMSQKLTEASLSRYFDSTESYMSSEFRKNFVQSYDSFAIHEKERIDNTSWMQDINPEKLELKPEVWHFWPFTIGSYGYQISKEKMAALFPDAPEGKREEVRILFNANAELFEINTHERAAQFFAQIREEVGDSLLGKEEDLWYSVEGLRGKAYFLTYTTEADQLGYKRITSDEYAILSEQDKGKYTKRKSYYYSQFPQEYEIAKRVYACPNGYFELIQGGDESGWLYRGKGFIQLTWLVNYKDVQKVLEDKIKGFEFDIVNNPEVLLETKVGFLSALGFWELKKINNVVDGTIESTDRVTDIVNKRTPSRAERRQHFLDAYKVLTGRLDIIDE